MALKEEVLNPLIESIMNVLNNESYEESFVKMLCGETVDIFPTITDGLRSQKILDSILESSEKHCWVDI